MKFPLYGGATWELRDDGTLDLSALTIEALAHGLAHVNRFCGAAGVYSVAEHSVILAGYSAGGVHAKAALLHDCDEALGLADAHGWLKKRFCPDLRAFADQLKNAAWDVLVGGTPPDWESLKPADTMLGNWEAKAFGFPHTWEWPGSMDGPYCWSPLNAKARFLEAWEAAKC